MFTGIIETMGEVIAIAQEGTNLSISISSEIIEELELDQSVAHNGICLTVVAIEKNWYTVTAIKETFDKTTIGSLRVGDKINLERALKLGDRLDGHLVQGHVDQTAICTNIKEVEGSWIFSFNYNPNSLNITIEKGSITVDGASLTVIDSKANSFSVAVIPYTYRHTLFGTYSVGSRVNLEFDVIGKYIARLNQAQQ